MTSSSEATTDTMAPRSVACISRARSAISLRPASTSSTPAWIAAAISPTLCPITTAGVTPQDSQRAASAISRVTSAGWVTRVSSITAGSSPYNVSSASDAPSRG